MAKPIFVTDNDVERILQEIRTQLTGMKSFGSIDIKKNFTKDDRKATILFTEDAWNKVNALVREFDTEVQWHGCVNRISENEFEIYDILVPPHVVTGSTVTSDQAKYEEWLDKLPNNVFDFLHFHGHSHVNMGCSPSGVDTKYRQDVVTQLPIPRNEDDDSFYIFLIFNKRGEWTGEIYDLKYNALYETNEIVIDVYTGSDEFLSEFIANAKKMAIKETPAYKGVIGYGGYYGTPAAAASGGYYGKKKDAKKPATKPEVPKSAYPDPYDDTPYYWERYD